MRIVIGWAKRVWNHNFRFLSFNRAVGVFRKNPTAKWMHRWKRGWMPLFSRNFFEYQFPHKHVFRNSGGYGIIFGHKFQFIHLFFLFCREFNSTQIWAAAKNRRRGINYDHYLFWHFHISRKYEKYFNLYIHIHLAFSLIFHHGATFVYHIDLLKGTFILLILTVNVWNELK